MEQGSIFELLESRVRQALKKIAEQKKTIETLIGEKQELERIIEQKEREIAELRRQLAAVPKDQLGLLEEFQAREMKLKARLQELVEKIDKVRLLE